MVANCLLPPEIQLEIFSYFNLGAECPLDANRLRKSYLATCSLVCRSWVHSSRFCLFDDIVLSSSNMEQFKSLILSEKCTIPRSCAKLTFGAIQTRCGTCFWITEHIGVLSSHFSHVNTLCISHLNMQWFHLPSFLESVQKWRVNALELKNLTFLLDVHLFILSFIQKLDTIRSVSLMRTSSFNRSSGIIKIDDASIKAPLQRCQFDGAGSATVLDAYSTGILSTVTHLELHDLSSSSATVAQAILREREDQLMEFSIGFRPPCVLDCAIALPIPLDLSSNSQLQKLSIRVRPYVSHDFELAQTTAASLPISHPILHIVIEFRATKAQYYDDPRSDINFMSSRGQDYFKEVDDKLGRLAQLSSIQVLYRAEMTSVLRSRLVKTLKKCMPVCSKKDILSYAVEPKIP